MDALGEDVAVYIRRFRVFAPGNIAACFVQMLRLGAANSAEDANHSLRPRHGAYFEADAARIQLVPQAITRARRNKPHIGEIVIGQNRRTAMLGDDFMKLPG